MRQIFLNVFNMSISASWLILAVLFVRILMKNAPKTLRYMFWLLVAMRLVISPSWECSWSMIPSVETVPVEIVDARIPKIESGITSVNQFINPALAKMTASNQVNHINPMPKIIGVSSVIWIVGVISMLTYILVSYFRLRLKIRVSIKVRDNIWVCDEITSPFILGMFFPRIYIPLDTKETVISYIVAHEEEHLKYHDNWWKPLGFVILAVHWFNPLVWLSYFTMCKDMELACDERVIWRMNSEEKKAYSEILLSFGEMKRSVAACPVAFGEVGIKQRIQSIISFKRPSGWIVVVTLLLTIIIGVCFMTNPEGEMGIPDVGPGPSLDDEPADDIMAAFKKLYESDFTYNQINIVRKEDNAEVMPIAQEFIGEYTADSSVEHITLAAGENDWTEMYRYNEAGKDKIKLYMDEKWVDMESDRNYFYGYGEELVLDTAYHGSSVEKDLTVIRCYSTYYMVDLGALYDLPVELIATVSQQYDVEKETGLIRSINTDVYELHEKLIIANQMDLHGYSYEEARGKMEEIKMQTEFPDSVYVDIIYEDVEIEIPQ